MKIGLIRETKDPFERRTALIPEQLSVLSARYPLHHFQVESSKVRIFNDQEYQNAGIDVVENISACDILLGIKEPEIQSLIPEKTYLFFSHTAKKQPHNREMLKHLATLKCTLIDYEFLTINGKRTASFGYWGGIVGGYNALRGYGILKSLHTLKPAWQCADFRELKAELAGMSFPSPVSLVITGEGRVSAGVQRILSDIGFKRSSPEDFLARRSPVNNFCVLGPKYYTQHKKGIPFSFDHFADHPEEYETAFIPFTEKADILIGCHYWDQQAPMLFTCDTIRNRNFRIRFIADISCDIPGSLPTTLRTSSIGSPFYGVSLNTCREIKPFTEDELTVMAVDNLPAELPRISSVSFGAQLVDSVIPDLLSGKPSELLHAATIMERGNLTPKFSYLTDFLKAC